MTPRGLVAAVALVFSVPVLAQAAPAPAAGQAAAAAKSFTVTATLAPDSVLLGERAVVAGTVRPVRDARVLVQARDGDAWVTIARRALDDEGRYRYAFRPRAPGEHSYRVKMKRMGQVGAGTSPVRTLSVAEEALVVFRIAAGTGASDWNTAATTVTARVGDTLRIVNDDTMAHRVHTDGSPFPHQQEDIPPGGSAEFVLESAYDSGVQPTLYCHVHGTSSQFWLDVVD